jgi:predicted TIM-barrel fold metal-dependent hydrolase
VQKAKDDRIRAVFGYDKTTGKMQYDLHDLKLCFGHFGGDDEWQRFFESDRDNYASQLEKHPGTGIDFTHHDNGEDAPGKLEQIWKGVDWYSIICSLMWQYPNVYSDISYIVHNPDILPLLKKTLQKDNGRLRERVLYGTDFYVVRNHKSDKNMLADMLAGLTEEEFGLIARTNPGSYLLSK